MQFLSKTPIYPRAFRHLAWSNFAAQTAEQLALAAAPLVAVLMFGAREGATGLLQAMQTLPFLVLTLPAGVLADRMSRRKLMVAGEAVRLGALLASLILMITHTLTLPLLAGLGMLGAIGTVAFSVAGPTLVPSLVRHDQLGAANGRIELARSAAFAAGPALGGALVGRIGASAAFVMASMLSAVAVWLLRRVREPEAKAAPRRRPLAELAEGGGFVLRHTLLRPILATAILFNIGFFILQAVYVPYAAHHLHLDAAGIGATMAVYGLGMIAGAIAAPRLMRRLAAGTVIAIGPVAGLLASILMFATIRWPFAWLAGLSFLLIGAGPVLWVVSSTTLRQAVTPARLLGRVSAVIMTATFGARPLGALLGAAVGSTAGAAWCLGLAMACFAVQALIILKSKVAGLQDIPSSMGQPA